MEQVIEITVVCVLGALLTLVLRRGTPEAALLLSLAAVVAAVLVLTGSIGEILNFLRNLTDLSGVSEDLFVPLFKTVGIALVVKVGGNLCRDAGSRLWLPRLKPPAQSVPCWWRCRCCKPCCLY